MTRIFDGFFERAREQKRLPETADPIASDGHMHVRYRPRLVAESMLEAATVRTLMRLLLDACRRQDEYAQISCLYNFADCFRRITLIKRVQLYPYLRCALERDQASMIHFNAVQSDVQRHALRIEAILTEYLGAPWDDTCRRRFVGDVARAARMLGQMLRQEETTLFPLYLPPDQYHYLGGPSVA